MTPTWGACRNAHKSGSGNWPRSRLRPQPAAPRRRDAAAVNPQKRRAIFERLREHNPAPRTELITSHAVRTVDRGDSLGAGHRQKREQGHAAVLYEVANTPASMLALGLAGITPYIKSIGLYNSKAKNIIATCEALLARHGGEVPRTREALEELPGVGRKTANVVMNTAFGKSTMAVDTHIFRVANQNRACAGQERACRGGQADEVRARRFLEGRSSLADPAWTLCVHCSKTRLPDASSRICANIATRPEWPRRE